MLPHSATHGFAVILAFLIGWREVLSNIWAFLQKPYTTGNGSINFSINTLAEGVIIFAVAIILSRWVSDLLRRRIAKRAYLDPGIQYTLGRLAQYLVITLGVLLALTIGLGVNLTSLAVIFTALSVGIGFGLQYIAADIASGFI